MTREEEIVNASNELFNSVRCGKSYRLGFGVGIKWADEHHRWRSVEEELPKQDEEVIVLCDDLNVAPNYRISFGHIVDKTTCQDYNGWNIPNVVYWFPMPKLPNK